MEAMGWSDAEDPERFDALRMLPTQGALLALRREGRLTLHVPRPADAALHAGAPHFIALRPAAFAAGVSADLPEGMKPLAAAEEVSGKPLPTPEFWSIDDFVSWSEGKVLSPRAEPALPAVETRTHVRIGRQTDAAEDGMLFRTDAHDFSAARAQVGFSSHDWVFIGRGPAGMTEGLVVFGGERRLSRLAAVVGDDPLAMPQTLRESCAQQRGIALTLATPALFAHGWRPGWLQRTSAGVFEGAPPGHPGLHLRLVAARIGRWQPISGWDVRTQQPKPGRRAVAAGSTYWFESAYGEFDASPLWLAALSDDEQDRRDGFGLALVRPWSLAPSPQA
jgi:CRISPR-associated protein Cmr3